jgi:hypothetical protein
MQIFNIILIATVVFVFLIRKSVRNARKRKMLTWKVGDVMILRSGKGVILRGWTLDFIYISEKHSLKTTTKLKINRLDKNKSDLWRNNFDECQKTMGIEPQFDRDAVSSMASSNGRINGSRIIDGKSIELLTEIECQIYLKECLKDEDYETAELIKKQLEKYR